jgi:hypothetical protein
MKRKEPPHTYALCVDNRGYKASLMVRRLYSTLPDAEAEARGLVRVIDESGEDYLFPQKLFAALDVPEALQARLASHSA